jgi:hypothetical protein
MTDDTPSDEEETGGSWMPTQRLCLVLCHLYLVPWFARRLFSCELPLRPFLDANPNLDLGGLPIASKLSRYGTDPPYLPCLVVDENTDGAALDAFADTHAFPLVLKPVFGAHSRGVQKLHGPGDLASVAVDEPMILQPFVDAPKEYGINVIRVGGRVKIYGLTEVTLRAVWGDGCRSLNELVAQKYGTDAAPVDEGGRVPDDGEHVPLQDAVDPGGGSSFRDVTDAGTPALRKACQEAADQIGLRFGRFDVKAESLAALQAGEFWILEVNGSPSLDLTLYDDQHPLSVKIERLRAHWEQLFQQARPCQSDDRNSWYLLSTLLWFACAPEQYAASLRNEVDEGELASGA